MCVCVCVCVCVRLSEYACVCVCNVYMSISSYDANILSKFNTTHLFNYPSVLLKKRMTLAQNANSKVKEYTYVQKHKHIKVDRAG